MRASMTIAIVSLIAVTLMVQLYRPSVAEAQCDGRVVTVGIDYMKAIKTTDGVNLGFAKVNPTDEIYFATAAAMSKDAASSLAPFTSRQIKFKKNRVYDPLYRPASATYCLGNGQQLLLTVTIREADDFDFQSLTHVLTAGGAALGAFLLEDKALKDLAVSEARQAALDMVDQLKKGSDDTVGAFIVGVINHGGQLEYEWQPLQGTEMYRYGQSDMQYTTLSDAAASFDMKHAGHYRLNVSIWSW